MADDYKDRTPLGADDALQDARSALGDTVVDLADYRELRLSELCDIFLSDDNDARHQAIARMLHDGVSTVDLIDHVVPAVARLLGQRWADDDLSFVEVTIGSARLQEEVRGLIAKEKANGPDHIGAPLCGKSAQRVLMVIPRAEEHTLGPFVAAHQFRRFGYDVDTAVDQSAKQIAIMLKQHRYCMVGLTTAGLKSLASTRDLVDIIRRTVAEGTPIVLGGSLITTEQNLKAETGVDYVVHSVRDALDLCGLSIVELDPPREIVQSY